MCLFRELNILKNKNNYIENRLTIMLSLRTNKREKKIYRMEENIIFAIFYF